MSAKSQLGGPSRTRTVGKQAHENNTSYEAQGRYAGNAEILLLEMWPSVNSCGRPPKWSLV